MKTEQTNEVKKPEELRVTTKKKRQSTLENKGPLSVPGIPGYHLRWVLMDDETELQAVRMDCARIRHCQARRICQRFYGLRPRIQHGTAAHGPRH